MVARNISILEAKTALHGLRVLVVEDEYMVASLIADYLANLGCEVIGPVRSSGRALEVIAQEHPDAAVLDINLNPGTSAPVARALEHEGLPFLYMTGYEDLTMLPAELRDHPILRKPMSQRMFSRAMLDLATPQTGSHTDQS